MHREYDTAKRITTADLRKLGKTLKQPTIQATGTGVPSKNFIDATIGAGYAMPDWFGLTLTATGQGRDPSIASPAGRARAAWAAELDAHRLLLEQIHALRLSSTLTVRDFVQAHEAIAPLVDAIIAPAPSSAPRYDQGLAEVSLSVAAAEVWAVVHEQMLIDARK